MSEASEKGEVVSLNMNFSGPISYDVVDLKNKFDAFRIFKTICEDFNYEDFCIIDITQLSCDFSYGDALVLHTFGDISIALLDEVSNANFDPIVEYMCSEINPRTFTTHDFVGSENRPRLLDQLGLSELTIVPLSASSGRRFGIIYLRKQIDTKLQDELGMLLLRSIHEFQRFYKSVLAKELSGELIDREIGIIQLAAEGKTSVEIARTLGVSEHTINSDMASMLKKMNANNRTHLITLAIKRGIIQ